MERDREIARYRKWYAALVRLYPKPFRERFGEGMAQTFNDLCRERKQTGGSLFPFVFRAYFETAAEILRERMTTTSTQTKRIIRLAFVTGILLLVPLVAMQLTDEVVWTPLDFMVAGGLLFGAGLAYEVAARNARDTLHRTATALAVLAALMLIWVNLAVGIIGSEDNPANGLYLGVLAVLGIGVLLARFRPRGMALALFATAVAQALVPLIALVIWSPLVASTQALLISLGANAFFVVLFAGSALLFRRGSRAKISGP